MKQSPLTTRLLTLILALLGTAGAGAQTPAPAPDKNVLKARLAAQQKRADLLLDEIKFADARIEDRADGCWQGRGNSRPTAAASRRTAFPSRVLLKAF